MSNPDSSLQQLVHQHTRKVGLFLLVLGCGLIYWELIRPIQESQAGVQEIRISLKGAMVGIMGLVLGLSFILFGPQAASILRPAADQSKIPAYVAGFVLGGIGLAAYIGVKHFLESKGYLFH